MKRIRDRPIHGFSHPEQLPPVPVPTKPKKETKAEREQREEREFFDALDADRSIPCQVYDASGNLMTEYVPYEKGL